VISYLLHDSQSLRITKLTWKEEMQQTGRSTAQLHPTSEYAAQSLHTSMANHVPDAEFHVSVSYPGDQKISSTRHWSCHYLQQTVRRINT